ncbi:ABC transporter permease [Oceanivirga miroungae]|uniref:Binding-protein-dependent transport system inner membrane protein n=1 Tax=Oceanivirga miroungae TaxID=1130046 RepID=A0A6I8MDM0_9FUSO|nr:ABC transporter permease [Oceanivirga miroungae]VWL85264.1 binding-protein-dependent transport system inner membrane protein [Oceanivirga miroungae]
MYYIKKLLKGILSTYIISTVTFFLISLIPGDPALMILGIDANIEELERFRQSFGLDKNIFVRYIDWLYSLIKGDFGISYRYNLPVKELIAETLPVTILITIISLLIIFFTSVVFSFYLNKIKSKTLKKIYEIILGISISIPTFWLGVIFIFVFSIILKLFYIGYNGTVSSIVLPCVIISIPYIGIMTINLKENLYNEERQDYVKFLYSNGISIRYLNLYTLKNAIITTIPLFGIILIDLITGVVIVEKIFAIPGIGRLLLSSISNRDIRLLQGLIVYTSLCVIVINILIDYLYGILDKRIRVDKHE